MSWVAIIQIFSWMLPVIRRFKELKAYSPESAIHLKAALKETSITQGVINSYILNKSIGQTSEGFVYLNVNAIRKRTIIETLFIWLIGALFMVLVLIFPPLNYPGINSTLIVLLIIFFSFFFVSVIVSLPLFYLRKV